MAAFRGLAVSRKVTLVVVLLARFTRLSHCVAIAGLSSPCRYRCSSTCACCVEAPEVPLCVASLCGTSWVSTSSRAGDLPKAGIGGPVKPAKKTVRIPALIGAIDGFSHWVDEHVAVEAGAVSQSCSWCGHLVRVVALAGSAGLWGTGCRQRVRELMAPKRCHRGIDGMVDMAGDGTRATPRRAWAAGTDRVREPSRGMPGGNDRCCAATRRCKPPAESSAVLVEVCGDVRSVTFSERGIPWVHLD
jgi:hypothetical protein